MLGLRGGSAARQSLRSSIYMHMGMGAHAKSEAAGRARCVCNEDKDCVEGEANEANRPA